MKSNKICNGCLPASTPRLRMPLFTSPSSAFKIKDGGQTFLKEIVCAFSPKLPLHHKSLAPMSYFSKFPPSLFNCSAFNLLFFESVCLIALFCNVEQSVVCSYKLYLHVRSTNLTGRQGKCLRGLWKNALDRGVFFFLSLFLVWFVWLCIYLFFNGKVKMNRKKVVFKRQHHSRFFIVWQDCSARGCHQWSTCYCSSSHPWWS